MSDSDSPAQNWSVCTCNACSGHLEFDASNAGTTVQCPHCGQETLLFIPEVALPRSPEPQETPPKPEPKKAEIIEQTSYEDTGVEGRLELAQTGDFGGDSKIGEHLATAGDLILFLSLIGAGLALFVAAVKHDEHSGILALGGVVAIVLGVVVWLLFGAGAEVIRLLKHVNQSKFTGQITQRSAHRSYKCSLCGATAKPAQLKCFRCGAEFTQESRLVSATVPTKLGA
jgi:DNA-directed RNA polymerase subunit RPC12/RpoP